MKALATGMSEPCMLNLGYFLGHGLAVPFRGRVDVVDDELSDVTFDAGEGAVVEVELSAGVCAGALAKGVGRVLTGAMQAAAGIDVRG